MEEVLLVALLGDDEVCKAIAHNSDSYELMTQFSKYLESNGVEYDMIIMEDIKRLD